MTKSLAFKLVVAFLMVSVAGALLTTLFARWATFQEFDRLVLGQAQNRFLSSATAYYEATGSWEGVEAYFEGRASAAAPDPRPEPQPGSGGQPGGQAPPQGPPPGQQLPVVQQPAYIFALADPSGIIVLPAGPYRRGAQVSSDELADGQTIEVDGQLVGTALITGEPPPLAPQEDHYLRRTSRSSLYAALAGVLIALTLGVVLARALTRPLRELTFASRAMARGELSQQVAVRSQDELGELAVAFNQMSADLAQANALRRQMTADIAHDLRSPLTVLAGYLEALRDGVLEPSPDRFETLHQEAQHLQRLVEDLRILSLADAGELSLNRAPVSPRLLLEQAVAAHGHQARVQGVELRLDASEALPEVDVDADRMAQVLGNLIVNALRHTPQGGQVVLAGRQDGSMVHLVVQDNGQGIPPEVLPRVFDRLYRGDQARPATGGESGLGLAIARSVVELHGGTISVESALGEGAAFMVALPCAKEKARELDTSRIKKS